MLSRQGGLSKLASLHATTISPHICSIIACWPPVMLPEQCIVLVEGHPHNTLHVTVTMQPQLAHLSMQCQTYGLVLYVRP